MPEPLCSIPYNWVMSENMLIDLLGSSWKVHISHVHIDWRICYSICPWMETTLVMLSMILLLVVAGCIFYQRKKIVAEYDRSLRSSYKDVVYQGFAVGFALGFSLLILFYNHALALWYGYELIINQGYSGGKVINIIFSVLQGGVSLGQTSLFLTAFAAGQEVAYQMFEVIHRKPEIDVYDTKGMVNRMTVVVAHRLRTIRNVDMIVVV
eukprot:Gb_29989 [translate_table: standard]